MVKKLILIVNGRGGVGKDTLCEALGRRHRVQNVSAIDPIKQVARGCGWKGEKDDKARRFLAELKQAFIHYNDLPTVYLRERTEEFLRGEDEILIVQIREADQIERYRRAIEPARSTALLVKRRAVDEAHRFGNDADDGVEAYTYDYTFDNDKSVEESAQAFIALVESIAGQA